MKIDHESGIASVIHARAMTVIDIAKKGYNFDPANSVLGKIITR